jgi:hypothetical protein
VPLDARIPLGVTPVDPNGFTNALAAGMKMREVQNASDRLARADERTEAKNALAVAKDAAIRKYGMSARGPEDLKTLYAEGGGAAGAEVEKNTADAGYSKVRTDKLTSEATMKKHAVVSQLLTSAVDEPSYQQVRAQVIEIEPTAAKSWPPHYDPAFISITQRRGQAVGDQLAVQKAGQPTVANTTTDGLVIYDPNNPQGGVTPLPGQTPKAPTVRAPRYVKTPAGTMVMDPEHPDLPGPIVAGTAPTPKPPKAPTAAQTKAGLLTGEAELADTTMKGLEKKGYDPTDLGAYFDRIAEKGGMTTSWLASSQGQTYLSAAREYVASVGYGKSGANLTETEWENGRQTYIPMPGDSKERLAFKAKARAKGLEGMYTQAGPAYRPHGTPGDGSVVPPPAGGGAGPADERAELERLRALKAGGGR